MKAMDQNATKDPPSQSSFKGYPILTLVPNGKFPFSFGLGKAKLIIAYIEEIKAFILEHTK